LIFSLLPQYRERAKPRVCGNKEKLKSAQKPPQKLALRGKFVFAYAANRAGPIGGQIRPFRVKPAANKNHRLKSNDGKEFWLVSKPSNLHPAAAEIKPHRKLAGKSTHFSMAVVSTMTTARIHNTTPFFARHKA